MSEKPLRIVVLGLSITSSWGNGHATTFRGLMRELVARRHQVLFLERDRPWLAAHRDLPHPPYGRTALYRDLDELRTHWGEDVRDADLVIVGSYVPEGIEVGEWVLATSRGLPAFYDIDTPVTIASLRRHACEYLTADQVKRYRLYLSFTGGPTLSLLESALGSPRARALYCSADPTSYFPEQHPRQWELGYLGTYGADRQPALDRLLVEPARRLAESRFVVAGSPYPQTLEWPRNVDRIDHVAPAEHRAFYNMQRFTLNVTRADMVAAGWSPSVRLFEAAACATPIISDDWTGLDALFLVGEELLVARDADEVVRLLRELPEDERLELGRRGRERVLAAHTASHRVDELLQHVRDAREA